MLGKYFAILFILLAFMASGCASLVDGRRQAVSFSSDPAGAQVIINGKPMGVTPTSIVLERSDYDKAGVIFKKDGFQDQQATITTKLNAWFWGNVIFGGLIGSTTDAASGAMWEFSPNSYFVSLPPLKTSKAEIAQWNYVNKVRKFVLYSYEQLASDLAKGEGESLKSLYSLLNLTNVDEGQSTAVFTELKALALSCENAPVFAEAVLKQFLKIPL